MEVSFEPEIDLQERVKAVTLGEFALLQQITEERVWEMLEEGQLSARFINDTILIFRESLETESVSIQAPLARMPEAAQAYEPAIDTDSWLPHEIEIRAPEAQAQKEVFAEDSLSKQNIALAESLLKAKDELLALKDDKIFFLQKQIEAHEDEKRRLRRELENYQTLCKISSNPQLLKALVD